VQGTTIEITFDHTIQNLGLPLSLVLSKFLSTFTSINTFSDLVVKNKNGVLKKWDHHLGMINYI
jgi:type VI protein secretion system component VasA